MAPRGSNFSVSRLTTINSSLSRGRSRRISVRSWVGPNIEAMTDTVDPMQYRNRIEEALVACGSCSGDGFDTTILSISLPACESVARCDSNSPLIRPLLLRQAGRARQI